MSYLFDVTTETQVLHWLDQKDSSYWNLTSISILKVIAQTIMYLEIAQHKQNTVADSSTNIKSGE